jgi:hypothetical protein
MQSPASPPDGMKDQYRALKLCRNCRHWDDLYGKAQGLQPEQAGTCRRSPPLHMQHIDEATLFSRSSQSSKELISGVRPGLWPMTSGGDWCAEWGKRNAPPERVPSAPKDRPFARASL